MSDKFHSDQSIFEIAKHVLSPQALDRFLDQACDGDVEQRQRVVELLKALHEDTGFLESLASALKLAPTLDLPAVTLAGDQIGPYKLLEQIGEGGMGTVWMAEQQEPVRRRVALKLIKAGMDSRQVLARFEVERQALSLMDHPNIAKVLDAGTIGAGGRRRESKVVERTADNTATQKKWPDSALERSLSKGDSPFSNPLPPASNPPSFSRPYFVMELVKGQPITVYCDEHRLTPHERLELLLPVCHAIQHAHQKGIIHRDIKPSNVLVAEYDGCPVAKVIDFGVAKALHQPLTEQTNFTGLGQMIGTLEYMSPEQSVSQLDIDTRSDVYSLGVLIYELLTGNTPFDKQRMRDAALDELLRIIREEEPPRPSCRLSNSETLPTIAANRNTEPTRLSMLVRGELDWIVMKALDKDRNRRYETANGFAMDIQRYLNDEAVLACPPSAGYRLRKFASRNRSALFGAALVASALVFGLVGTSLQAIRATRAERLAESNAQEALQKSNQLELASQDLRQIGRQEQQARQEAQKRLRQALVSSARAGRQSGEIGQRFEGLKALQEAAQIQPGPDIRNEAVACMSLVDLRPIEELQIHDPEFRVVAYDHNLERYVRNLEDGGLGIFQLQNHKELFRLPSLNSFVNSWWLQFSPNGKWLNLIYGAGSETRFVVWNLLSQEICLDVQNGGFQLAGYRDDLLAFRGAANEICIHDLEQSRELIRIENHELGRPEFFEFHPWEPVLAVSSSFSQKICLYDTQTEELRMQIALQDNGRYLAWSRDGSLLAVSEDRDIGVYQYPSGRMLSRLKGHQAQVCFLRFHPTENLLISDSWDDSFRIWDPYRGRQLIRGQGYCKGISPDGRRFAFSHRFHTGILELTPGVECRALREQVGKSGNHRGLRFDSQGRLLFSGHDYGASVWDIASHTQLCHLEIGNVNTSVWFEPPSMLITVGDLSSLGWRLRLEDQNRTFDLGPPVRFVQNATRSAGNMVCDEHRQYLFLSHDNGGNIQVIDAVANQIDHEYIGNFRQLSFCPANKLLAASEFRGSGRVCVWNTESQKLIAEIPGNRNVRIAVAFSPDGSRLAISDQLSTRVMDTSDWTLIWEQEKPEGVGSNFMATISPDGYHLALVEAGIKVSLLELETGRPLAMLESKADMLTDMVFSPNGSLLAVMGGDLTIYLWDLHALRARLSELSLDWDAPVIPPPPDFSTVKGLPPLVARVDYGDPSVYPENTSIHETALKAFRGDMSFSESPER